MMKGAVAAVPTRICISRQSVFPGFAFKYLWVCTYSLTAARQLLPPPPEEHLESQENDENESQDDVARFHQFEARGRGVWLLVLALQTRARDEQDDAEEKERSCGDGCETERLIVAEIEGQAAAMYCQLSVLGLDNWA